MAFAERLKAVREAAGMSVYELAKRTKLHRQSLHQLENGYGNPLWETVQRIVKALGIDYAALEDPALELPPYTPGQRGRPPKTEQPKKRKGKR